jgi:nicotinate (nicotinamide) nucleotide adenylyltransferase
VLAKVALRLRELGPTCTRQKVILVGSGLYNPLHRLHLRMFYLARQFLEGHSHFEVLGGIVSPSHPTEVRQKFRQKPKEIIPPKHRLAMARAAVGDSAWLTVDPWEITRRRVLDYLSVLDHVREIIADAFPEENIKLIMLTDGNELPKLSTKSLVDRNARCLCICRPMQVDILLKQLTTEWKNVAYVLEDTAILANDLERISSSSVRKDAIDGKDVSKSVGKKVANYMRRNHIALKMGGQERWNKDDKTFDFEGEDETDRPYAVMPEKELTGMKIAKREEQEMAAQFNFVKHKEEFSLLF